MRGNQIATIDEKGRLKVPSVFRQEIEQAHESSEFYITSLKGDSVLIYPLSIWQEIEDRLAKLPALNPTKKKFLDRTNYYGQLASLDKSGRILIPPILRDTAKMSGEVVVLGQLNYLDVWNHERFLSKLKEQEFTEEDHQTLGELGI
jgi:MraZ protein